MQLRFLVKSKAGPSGQPLDDAVVEKCENLRQVAVLARDQGFLPQVLFEKVKSFNAARIRAIHKLLTGTVTISELEAAAFLSDSTLQTDSGFMAKDNAWAGTACR